MKFVDSTSEKINLKTKTRKRTMLANKEDEGTDTPHLSLLKPSIEPVDVNKTLTSKLSNRKVLYVIGTVAVVAVM